MLTKQLRHVIWLWLVGTFTHVRYVTVRTYVRSTGSVDDRIGKSEIDVSFHSKSPPFFPFSSKDASCWLACVLLKAYQYDRYRSPHAK